MSYRIRRLPQQVTDAVRSTAHVADLAGAAIELVLNSIQAGAHSIHIAVNVEKWSLIVSDDGNGIPADSLPLLGQWFCTSKQPPCRGAALASLAQLSQQVTITTRAAGSFETHKVHLVDSGGPCSQSAPALAIPTSTTGGHNAHAPTLCPVSRQRQGTTVQLSGFLHNQPVRRSRLLQQHGGSGAAGSTALQELKLALLLLMLPHTGVELSLKQAGSSASLMHLPQDRVLQSCLEQLFLQQPSQQQGTSLQHICSPHVHGWQVSGCVLAAPTPAPSNKQQQLLYVNSRRVGCPVLAQLLKDWFNKHVRANTAANGTGGLLSGQPAGSSRAPEPSYALLLSCPPSACTISIQPGNAGAPADFGSSMGQLCEVLQMALAPHWGSIPSAWRKASAADARRSSEQLKPLWAKGNSMARSGAETGQGLTQGGLSSARGAAAGLLSAQSQPLSGPDLLVHGLQLSSHTRSLAGLQAIQAPAFDAGDVQERLHLHSLPSGPSTSKTHRSRHATYQDDTTAAMASAMHQQQAATKWGTQLPCTEQQLAGCAVQYDRHDEAAQLLASPTALAATDSMEAAMVSRPAQLEQQPRMQRSSNEHHQSVQQGLKRLGPAAAVVPSAAVAAAHDLPAVGGDHFPQQGQEQQSLGLPAAFQADMPCWSAVAACSFEETLGLSASTTTVSQQQCNTAAAAGKARWQACDVLLEAELNMLHPSLPGTDDCLGQQQQQFMQQNSKCMPGGNSPLDATAVHTSAVAEGDAMAFDLEAPQHWPAGSGGYSRKHCKAAGGSAAAWRASTMDVMQDAVRETTQGSLLMQELSNAAGAVGASCNWEACLSGADPAFGAAVHGATSTTTQHQQRWREASAASLSRRSLCTASAVLEPPGDGAAAATDLTDESLHQLLHLGTAAAADDDHAGRQADDLQPLHVSLRQLQQSLEPGAAAAGGSGGRKRRSGSSTVATCGAAGSAGTAHAVTDEDELCECPGWPASARAASGGSKRRRSSRGLSEAQQLSRREMHRSDTVAAGSLDLAGAATATDANADSAWLLAAQPPAAQGTWQQEELHPVQQQMQWLPPSGLRGDGTNLQDMLLHDTTASMDWDGSSRAFSVLSMQQQGCARDLASPPWMQAQDQQQMLSRSPNQWDQGGNLLGSPLTRVEQPGQQVAVGEDVQLGDMSPLAVWLHEQQQQQQVQQQQHRQLCGVHGCNTSPVPGLGLRGNSQLWQQEQQWVFSQFQLQSPLGSTGLTDFLLDEPLARTARDAEAGGSCVEAGTKLTEAAASCEAAAAAPGCSAAPAPATDGSTHQVAQPGAQAAAASGNGVGAEPAAGADAACQQPAAPFMDPSAAAASEDTVQQDGLEAATAESAAVGNAASKPSGMSPKFLGTAGHLPGSPNCSAGVASDADKGASAAQQPSRLAAACGSETPSKQLLPAVLLQPFSERLLQSAPPAAKKKRVFARSATCCTDNRAATTNSMSVVLTHAKKALQNVKLARSAVVQPQGPAPGPAAPQCAHQSDLAAAARAAAVATETAAVSTVAGAVQSRTHRRHTSPAVLGLQHNSGTDLSKPNQHQQHQAQQPAAQPSPEQQQQRKQRLCQLIQTRLPFRTVNGDLPKGSQPAKQPSVPMQVQAVKGPLKPAWVCSSQQHSKTSPAAGCVAQTTMSTPAVQQQPQPQPQRPATACQHTSTPAPGGDEHVGGIANTLPLATAAAAAKSPRQVLKSALKGGRGSSHDTERQQQQHSASKPRKRVRFSGIECTEEGLLAGIPSKQHEAAQHAEPNLQHTSLTEDSQITQPEPTSTPARDLLRIIQACPAKSGCADPAPTQCAAGTVAGCGSAPIKSPSEAGDGAVCDRQQRKASRFFTHKGSATQYAGDAQPTGLQSSLAVLRSRNRPPLSLSAAGSAVQPQADGVPAGLSSVSAAAGACNTSGRISSGGVSAFAAAVGSSHSPTVLTLEELAGPDRSLLVPEGVSRHQLQQAAVIAQADNKLVVARCGPVLLAIDQHAADERVQLEVLQRRLERQLGSPSTVPAAGNTGIALAGSSSIQGGSEAALEPLLVKQRLQRPQLLNLSLQEAQALQQHQQLVESWGWQVSATSTGPAAIAADGTQPAGSTSSGKHNADSEMPGPGPHTTAASGALLAGSMQGALQHVQLHQVPVLAGVQLGSVDLQLFLHQLLDTCGGSRTPPGVLRVLRSKACRTAIMFGDALTQLQSVELMQQLASTELCFMCAHGRPTTCALADMQQVNIRMHQLR